MPVHNKGGRKTLKDFGVQGGGIAGKRKVVKKVKKRKKAPRAQFGAGIPTIFKKKSAKSKPKPGKKQSKSINAPSLDLHKLSIIANKKSGMIGLPLPPPIFRRSKNTFDPQHVVVGGVWEQFPVPAEPTKRSTLGRDVAARVAKTRAKAEAEINALMQRGSFRTVQHSVGGFVTVGKN